MSDSRGHDEEPQRAREDGSEDAGGSSGGFVPPVPPGAPDESGTTAGGRPPERRERPWESPAGGEPVDRPAGSAAPGAGDRSRGSGAPRELELAGWGRRAGAALIDALIVGSIAVIVGLAAGVEAESAAAASDPEVNATLSAILVAVYAIYAPPLMWRTNGQTFGRMVTGIRVVRADGRPMSLLVAGGREVLIKMILIFGFVSQYTFGLAGLANVLWPLWDRENRALHDFPLDTRTVLA